MIQQANSSPSSPAARLRRQMAAAAEALLHSSPYLPLQNLSCDYLDGVLTLRGQVPTFYLKQLAQARLKGLTGVEAINNQIDVVPPGARRTMRETAQCEPVEREPLPCESVQKQTSDREIA